MLTRKDAAVRRQLATLFNLGVTRDLTDGQLLERFSTGRDEAAELAFAALVERHGPMVLRVCRALLPEPHDAQDAFQATFLILIKKARTLWIRDSLGPWLYQVAVRTASCARSAAARRRKHERRKADQTPNEFRDRPAAELERTLLEEIARLPERYRLPIVLCDLEGHTCAEAARRMGHPVGTVKCWRSRGRERLRRELTRLGLAPPAGLAAVLAPRLARAAGRALRANELVHSAAQAPWTTAGTGSAAVSTLVDGVLKTMLFSKLRTIAAAVFALALLAGGAGAIARVGLDDPPSADDVVPRERPSPAAAVAGQDARETWGLSLRDAIRIGLSNTDSLRVIALDTADGGPVIAPRNAERGTLRFKADVMANVRSIEQQYWSLDQQCTQLWASEQAVKLARAVLEQEQAELKVGRGRATDVAEAERYLKQLRLDVVAEADDVASAERQLRNVLGLPPTDGRRIQPITRPTRARFEPDRDTCLAAMLDKQPDIVRARRVSAVQVAMVRNSSAAVEHQKAAFQRVIDQATDTLEQSFAAMDASYIEFRSASRMRAAEAQRLEAQRRFYEEHRIPAGRYLDLISLHATAVADEAQLQAGYNVALVALEQAKGTLLDRDKITVVDDPTPARTGRTSGSKAASPPRPIGPGNSPDRTDSPAETNARPAVARQNRTFSFELTVGPRANPVSIRGSFTVRPGACREKR